MRARHVDQLIAQSVITGLHGTHSAAADPRAGRTGDLALAGMSVFGKSAPKRDSIPVTADVPLRCMPSTSRHTRPAACCWIGLPRIAVFLALRSDITAPTSVRISEYSGVARFEPAPLGQGITGRLRMPAHHVSASRGIPPTP